MTIYIRDKNGQWKKSWDNNRFIFTFNLYVARNRWIQLFLITPKHLILGLYYGYSLKAILSFIREHIRMCLKNEII